MDLEASESILGVDHHSRLESILLNEPLPTVRACDAFIAAKVRKFAKSIGCNESNITAAVNWALQSPSSIAISAGENRAKKLRDQQSTKPRTPTPPRAA